jgi:hypothetical protein
VNKATAKASLGGFRRFVEERTHLSDRMRQWSDPRRDPEIPLWHAGFGIVLGAGLGVRSFRQLDHEVLRQPGVRQELGCSRESVASDSTLFRLCEGLEEDEVTRLVQETGRHLRSQGLVGQSTLAERRVGIVDGTCQGKQELSVIVRWGEPLQVLAMAPIPKHGKERPTSVELLKTLAPASDPEGVDLMVGDDLYSAEPFFAACDAISAKGVVKTTQSDFIAVQHAEGIFERGRPGSDFLYEAWTDTERQRQVSLWLAHGLCWAYGERALSAARVEETPLKGKLARQVQRYWILSQDDTLSPQDLVRAVHGRWFIENNGFKVQNEQAHSKRGFSHDPKTARIITALQWLGRMLLGAYKAYLTQFKEHLQSFWDHGQLSWQALRTLLWTSLNEGTPDTS